MLIKKCKSYVIYNEMNRNYSFYDMFDFII